jgi:hypothetical protein
MLCSLDFLVLFRQGKRTRKKKNNTKLTQLLTNKKPEILIWDGVVYRHEARIDLKAFTPQNKHLKIAMAI